jgi:hypothetical protein
MKRFGTAASVLILLAVGTPAQAQGTAADYLRQAEAVDRALGPNAELGPPAPAAQLFPPPAPPPLWHWRQPFDQQPFFATRPFTPGGCVPRAGGPRC